MKAGAASFLNAESSHCAQRMVQEACKMHNMPFEPIPVRKNT